MTTVRDIIEDTNISRRFYCERKSNSANLLTGWKDFVCFLQNDLWWRGGYCYLRKTFNFLRVTRIVLIMSSFLRELKTPVLITKIDPKLQRQKLFLVFNLILQI